MGAGLPSRMGGGCQHTKLGAIASLHKSIALRMIGRGPRLPDPQDAAHLLHYFRFKIVCLGPNATGQEGKNDKAPDQPTLGQLLLPPGWE